MIHICFDNRLIVILVATLSEDAKLERTKVILGNIPSILG